MQATDHRLTLHYQPTNRSCGYTALSMLLSHYGNDKQGNFKIADPWKGDYTKQPETVICAITAAVIECDSQWFTI